MPGIMDRNQNGDQADEDRLFGIFWKCARVGERLSPYVSICCFLMAVSSLKPKIEEEREHGRKKDANATVDTVLYLLRWLNTFTFTFTSRKISHYETRDRTTYCSEEAAMVLWIGSLQSDGY
ncbi:hypothetical protein N7481_002745 [Penicillium waksmanii]|uniref:uncharacterized protein n=1 Tax=Penicillium waksmanii TaxID=69791 RepID=UPI002549A5F2|nr:uncharacterized protein N7481_002745 [Penicillium waksmanii]KAJ5995768.1 hypothetical protein N7481_002745 [Penicillium waksmanii]